MRWDKKCNADRNSRLHLNIWSQTIALINNLNGIEPATILITWWTLLVMIKLNISLQAIALNLSLKGLKEMITNKQLIMVLRQKM